MQHDGPAHERLRKPIEDIKFGMFTDRDAHGVLQAHPLTTLKNRWTKTPGFTSS